MIVTHDGNKEWHYNLTKSCTDGSNIGVTLYRCMLKSTMPNRPCLSTTQVHIFLSSPHYPDTVKKEWEAFFGQVFPLAEWLHCSPRSFKAQFTLVEELGRQREQGLMRTVVVDQLSHLVWYKSSFMLCIVQTTNIIKVQWQASCKHFMFSWPQHLCTANNF